MAAWTCPRCDRRFGAANRAHVCVPAMSIDDWFAGRPAVDRVIYDRIADAVADLDAAGDVEVEAVGVGVMFRARRTFLELRPRRVGLGASVFLPGGLASARVTRRMRSGSSGVANVVPLHDPDDVDDELVGWIAESYGFCRSHR